MKLEWYGHSCFRLCADEGTAVFDPYADDYVPGLPPIALEADAVFCSHEHNDHNARDKVTLSGREPRFTVEKIPCFHDELRGLKRGANTIHVIGAEGMRAAHLGDLGHRLSGRILKKLGKIDVLLIPVGGFYTIGPEDAAAIAADIGARITIPMHYRLGAVGYPVLAEPEDFLKRRSDVRYHEGNTLTIDAETPSQTAVLRLCHA